jgi:hypothetical protein
VRCAIGVAHVMPRESGHKICGGCRAITHPSPI